MKHIFLATTLLVGLLTGATAIAGEPEVKLSTSGICHDDSSPWYGRTKNYEAYSSMEDCLDVGRAPRGYSGATAGSTDTSTYDRDLFGGWADADSDCMNTRHELLAELSTRAPVLSGNGCRVIRGRWNDPYTGRVFLDSSNMDVDHMVPLYYAWQHGADSWTETKREKFANDPRNLFAVDAGENRSKSAKGPLEWLPPNEGFRCQYVTRFVRITRMYDLSLSRSETRRIKTLRGRLCP